MPALCQPVISIEGPSEASNSGGSKDRNDAHLAQVTEDGKLKDRHFGLEFGLRRSVSASATAASVNASASLTVSPSGNNDARLEVDGLNATDALSRSLSSLGLPLPGIGSGFVPGLLRTPKSSKGTDVKGSPGSGSMSASSSPGASLRVHDGESLNHKLTLSGKLMHNHRWSLSKSWFSSARFISESRE